MKNLFAVLFVVFSSLDLSNSAFIHIYADIHASNVQYEYDRIRYLKWEIEFYCQKGLGECWVE